MGCWDVALDLAERVLPIARALAPRTLLPQLLVWTGTVRIERDEIESAHALCSEAWELSGADSATADASSVNAIVPCSGMATYHLHQHDLAKVVAVADRGLAIVDRLGAIASGGQANFTLTMTPVQRGMFSFTMTLAGQQPDPNALNNVITRNITVN